MMFVAPSLLRHGLHIAVAASALLATTCICSRGHDVLLVTKLRDRMHTVSTSGPLFPIEISSLYGDAEMLSNALWRVSIDTYSNPEKVYSNRLFCVQMIARELVTADDIGVFIQGIRKWFAAHQIDRPWSIDYDYVPSSFNSSRQTTAREKGPKSKRSDRNKGGAYSAKTLFCTISQFIQTPPALDELDSALSFKIFETESSLHFCEVVTDYSLDIRQSKELWSCRPFQYSAALNLEVAEGFVNSLVHVFINTHAKMPMTMLDPCCGSGTTLYVARRLGLKTIGRDCNVRCVDGTRANLRHAGLYCDDMVQLGVQDASFYRGGNVVYDDVDIVVANFPWGINAVNYYGEIANILRALRLELKPGCIAGFILKDFRFYENVLRVNKFQVLNCIRLGDNKCQQDFDDGVDPSSFAVIAAVIE